MLGVSVSAKVEDLVRLDGYQISVISDQEPSVRGAGGPENWGADRRRVLFSSAFGGGLRWGRSRAHEREHTDSE